LSQNELRWKKESVITVKGLNSKHSDANREANFNPIYMLFKYIKKCEEAPSRALGNKLN
jgi:hypothetical protein